MKREPIAIATAADTAFAPHVGAMLHSVFSSNPGTTFAIHFLHGPGFDAAQLDRLRQLCVAHSAEFRPRPIAAQALAGLPVGARYRAEAWSKLLLASLLPDLARVLWLDADTLVLSPLRPLWDTDLGGKRLAVVRNALALEQWELPGGRGAGRNRDTYFNTGVMLLDLAALRRSGTEDALRQAAQRLAEVAHFADQDVYNAVIGGDYAPLPLAWNVVAGTYFNIEETLRMHGAAEFRSALRDPRIVHFSRLKPWEYQSSHPYRDAYLRHRAAAGFPPPAYAATTLRETFLRHFPIGLRVILGNLRRLRFAAALHYLRAASSR